MTSCSFGNFINDNCFAESLLKKGDAGIAVISTTGGVTYQANFNYLITATLLIPLILLVRYIAITIPLKIMGDKTNLPKGSAAVMTWCGLRGGISIALALSLPDSLEKSVIIAITYVVVAFSILVQGLSAKKVVDRIFHLH